MRNGILRHITLLCCLLPVFLTACQEEEQISKGKGRLILEDIGISIDAETRAFSLPPLNVSDIIIDIIDPLGAVIETGNIDHYAKGVDLFAATYTIKAYYGTKAQMNKTPYYEKSETVAIAENETKSITLTVGLANGIIIPNIPDDLIGNYNSVPVFYVSYGEEKIAVANGEALYVMPAENPYVLTLEGQNKANVNIVKSIGNLNVVAQKVYNINCQLTLPKLILPEQQNGAWAKRLYITPVVTKDAQDNVIPTPKGIVYKIQENNKEGETDNWTEWKTVTTSQITTDKEGTLEYITGLLPNKEYRIQVYLPNTSIHSNIINFTTEEDKNVPNSGMEEWYSVDGPKGNVFVGGPHWKRWYVRNTTDESSEGWCTLNGLTTSNNSALAYRSNSGTERTEDGIEGKYAAEIKTIAWGENTSAASPISKIEHNTPGELFLGKIDNSNNPIYGYSFTSRPDSLYFQYKYIPKGNHKFNVKIEIKDANKENIIEIQFQGEASSEYRLQKIPLTYNKFYSPAKSISICFNSGENSNDEVDTASTKPSSRHTGNKLYIDDISLIYNE